MTGPWPGGYRFIDPGALESPFPSYEVITRRVTS